MKLSNDSVLFLILVDIDCPAGMVYQQCVEACPRTCGIEENPEYVGGCVEGCFCPSEKVLWNGNCITEVECAGISMHFIKLNFCLCNQMY